MTVAQSFLTQYNLFLVGTIPVLLLVYYIFRLPHKRDFRKSRVLFGFLSVLISIGLILEIYYFNGCSNSIRFHQETEELAKQTYRVLNQLQVDFWLVFGNLLFALRKQQSIPMSDTDSDVGVDIAELPNGFKDIITNEFRLLKRHVVYNPQRMMVQIYSDPSMKGPHSDIWFYDHRQIIDGTKTYDVIYNDDYTIRAKNLPYEAIYPLSSSSFLNEPVKLPRDPHTIAKMEYGNSYMRPITTRLECMENVWNGYCFYKDLSGLVCTFFLFIIMTIGFYFLLCRMFVKTKHNYFPLARDYLP